MPTLDEVLQNFDRRLSAIEAKLVNISEAKLVNTSEAKATAADTARQAPTRPAAPVQVGPVMSASNRPAKPESGAGSFFGVVGVVFVLLAAVFFLKLTIDSGWLTPPRQILLAAFFGMGCLLLPHFARQLADDYGALLSGAGAAVLHLAWFGAYQLHHLIGADQALVLATAVGALSLLLNANHGNAVFVVVAVAGTYLSAPLIGYRSADVSGLSTFFLVWNLSFSALAYALRRRDVLLVAAYFAVLTVGFLTLGVAGSQPELLRQYLHLQALQFVIFAGATLAFSLSHRKPLATDEAWAMAVLLLIYYGNLYYVLEALLPGVAAWIGVLFSLLVLVLYQLARRYLRRELASAEAITTFAALALTHSLYIKIISDDTKPIASLALAGLVAVAGQRRAAAYWRSASLVAMGVIGYGAVLTFLGDNLSPDLRLAYNLAYGLAALAFAATLRGSQAASTGSLFLGLAHLEMLLGIYRLSLRVEAFSGSLFVSCGWGLYALAILLWGFTRRDKAVGQSAVLILAAVSLKAAIYDVLATGSLVRVVSLLGAGLLLYACGWIFNQMKAWE